MAGSSSAATISREDVKNALDSGVDLAKIVKARYPSVQVVLAGYTDSQADTSGVTEQPRSLGDDRVPIPLEVIHGTLEQKRVLAKI